MKDNWHLLGLSVEFMIVHLLTSKKVLLLVGWCWCTPLIPGQVPKQHRNHVSKTKKKKKKTFTNANMICISILQSLEVIKILYKIPQTLEDISSCGSDTSS